MVIEIITPYGEDLDDYTLSEYLSKNFPEKNFDNVTPLFISTHDSNAGTHHRVILIHSEQQKRSPLSFQDFNDLNPVRRNDKLDKASRYDSKNNNSLIDNNEGVPPPK